MATDRLRSAVRVAAWSGVVVLSAGALYGVASAQGFDTAARTGSRGGSTVAVAQTPGPSPSGSPTAEPRDRGHGHGFGHRHGGFGGFGFLGGRPLHGEAVVEKRDGSGTRTVVFQRGAVTAVSSTRLTVKSSDGFTQTWVLDGDTVIRKGGAKVAPGALAVGDAVGVAGERTSSAVVAKIVKVKDADDDERRGPGGSGSPQATPRGTPSDFEGDAEIVLALLAA